MYTVAEVAKKLNVTTQYIYQKMNNSMKEELENHIQEVAKGNRTVKVITERGVEIISDSLEEVAGEDNAIINKHIVSLLQDNLTILQDQLLAKDEQINVKDLQISELNERLKEQQELNKNNQVLIHRGQDQVKALQENKGWWDNFKGKFK